MSEKKLVVKVTKSAERGYEWANPTHGAFSLSNLEDVDAFMKRNNLEYIVVNKKNQSIC